MKIMEELKKKFDQAELLAIESEEIKIQLEDRDLKDFVGENLQRSALRVIKDGRLGSNSTYGSSDRVRENLIKGAEESVEYGDRAHFDFSTHRLQQIEEKSRQEFTDTETEQMFDFVNRFVKKVEEYKPDLTLNLRLKKELKNISLKTTTGGDLKQTIVNFSLHFGAPIPGGGSELYRTREQSSFFQELPLADIEDFLAEYDKSATISVPATDRMPVLFAPRSLYFLPISLQEGISARNVYRGTSPLINKCGERIMSEKITITDRPEMENSGQRRAFDDEGLPASRQTIIENGILNNYVYDQEYAARMEVEPTGNGLKKALFGSGIDTPVTPALINPVIEPGQADKSELIAAVDEGILVENVIGFHSSNYPQGHFSVQAHGFHIRDGKLQGRLQDVMLAGNIYEDFERVEGIGNQLYPTYEGYLPYLLVAGLMVSAD